MAAAACATPSVYEAFLGYWFSSLLLNPSTSSLLLWSLAPSCTSSATSSPPLLLLLLLQPHYYYHSQVRRPPAPAIASLMNTPLPSHVTNTIPKALFTVPQVHKLLHTISPPPPPPPHKLRSLCFLPSAWACLSGIRNSQPHYTCSSLTFTNSSSSSVLLLPSRPVLHITRYTQNCCTR